MADPLVGEVAALFTALLWTLCALAFSEAGRKVGSLSVNFIRLAFAALFLTVYCFLARGRALPLDATPQAWGYLALSGFIGFFIGDLALFRAFILIGPRLGMLIFSLAPPMTAVAAAALLGEHLTGRHWLAMGVTLSGIAWVVGQRGEKGVWLAETGAQYIQGIALALVGTLGQALGFVYSKKGLGDYDPFAATQIRMVPALLAFAVLLTIKGRWRRILDACRMVRPMLLLAGGALAGPFLGVSLSLFAIQRAPAGVVATLVSLPPVLILPFVWFFYGERITMRAVIGALIALIGVALLVL